MNVYLKKKEKEMLVESVRSWLTYKFVCESTLLIFVEP